MLRVLPSASTHTYSAKILSGGKGRAMYRSLTAGSSWDCPVLRSSMVNKCVEELEDDETMCLDDDDEVLVVGTTNAPEGTHATAKATAAAHNFMMMTDGRQARYRRRKDMRYGG